VATGQVKSTIVSYLGELFQSGRRPNMLLRLLGGLQGQVIEVKAKEFPVGVFWDLRAPAQPAILEGANAPTAQHRTLSQATNVVQIFHESVDATYLAQSDQTVSGVVPIPQHSGARGQLQNPRDVSFQVMAALDTIAQDANYSFLRGAYTNPADPSGTALKTRGLLTSIATNVVDQSAEAAPNAATYRGWVELLVRTVIQTNGYNPDDTWTLMADTTEFNNLQAAYESLASNRVPESREVAGMKIRQLYTRFGILNLVLEPDMPADTVGLFNLGVAGVVGLPVPNKGVLFEEALNKTGSSDKTQIYGQLGCAHGPEFCHGKLLVPAASSL